MRFVSSLSFYGLIFFHEVGGRKHQPRRETLNGLKLSIVCLLEYACQVPGVKQVYRFFQYHLQIKENCKEYLM